MQGSGSAWFASRGDRNLGAAPAHWRWRHPVLVLGNDRAWRLVRVDRDIARKFSGACMRKLAGAPPCCVCAVSSARGDLRPPASRAAGLLRISANTAAMYECCCRCDHITESAAAGSQRDAASPAARGQVLSGVQLSQPVCQMPLALNASVNVCRTGVTQWDWTHRLSLHMHAPSM